MPRRILWILLSLSILSLAAEPRPATDSRETVLAEIRAEIGRLEKGLRQLQARESSLDDRLRTVGFELELQQIRLEESIAAQELAEEKARRAELRVAELETALVAARTDLERRLEGMYRLGRQGYLRLFLSLETDRELLPAIRQLRFLAHRDQLALERYRSARDALVAERRRIAVERAEAQEWRRREQRRRDELVALRQRQERLRDRAVQERRLLAARAEELQVKERKLARLIASHLGQGPDLEGTPIQEFRGVLDWPLAGKVVAGFGSRRDPRYRTEVPHNGIDLAVDQSRETRAIFPGKVVYASEFEGYGPMVVLYHPGRVFTLYAGLSEIRAGKDDMVSLGQVLGTVSGTLYFEIRIENQPEDPLRWLR